MKKLLIPMLIIAVAGVGCSKSDDAPATTNGPAIGENNPPSQAKAAQNAPADAESAARAAAANKGGK